MGDNVPLLPVRFALTSALLGALSCASSTEPPASQPVPSAQSAPASAPEPPDFEEPPPTMDPAVEEAALANASSRTFDQLMRDARAALMKNQFALAECLCRHALHKRPDDMIAATMGGFAACNMQDVRLAKEYTRRVSAERKNMIRQVCLQGHTDTAPTLNKACIPLPAWPGSGESGEDAEDTQGE